MFSLGTTALSKWSSLVSLARHLANGWVTTFYVEPRVFFPYPGLEWIVPSPAPYHTFAEPPPINSRTVAHADEYAH